MKHRFLSAVLATAIMASAGGAAFAADNYSTAPKSGTMQVAALTKEQKQDIEKQCKTEYKHDKKAYKNCVKEKEKSTESGTTKM